MNTKNNNTKLVFRLPKSPDGNAPEIVIHVPKTHWIGKVKPGEYTMETPHSYATSEMMPLPAVRNLMDCGDIPHLKFTKEAYVLRRCPELRLVTQADDSDELFS